MQSVRLLNHMAVAKAVRDSLIESKGELHTELKEYSNDSDRAYSDSDN